MKIKWWPKWPNWSKIISFNRGMKLRWFSSKFGHWPSFGYVDQNWQTHLHTIWAIIRIAVKIPSIFTATFFEESLSRPHFSSFFLFLFFSPCGTTLNSVYTELHRKIRITPKNLKYTEKFGVHTQKIEEEEEEEEVSKIWKSKF